MEEGNRAGKMNWSEKATSILLDIWGEESTQVAFSNCKTSKQASQIYKSLLVQLQEKGISNITLKELINKIKKLKQKYRTAKDHAKRSGNARRKKWQHFEKMDQILSDRHNISPPFLVDTMAENDPVGEMKRKYGEGKTVVTKCTTCNYEQECCTEGVHTVGGVIRVYSNDDEFHCPNCNGTGFESQEQESADMLEVGTAEHTSAGTSGEVLHVAADVERVVDPGAPPSRPPKKGKMKRQTSIERSLDVVFRKFKETSDEEFERYSKLEDERAQREHEFHLRQLELENQRRREEREHEVRLLQVLMGAYSPTPPPTSYSLTENG